MVGNDSSLQIWYRLCGIECIPFIAICVIMKLPYHWIQVCGQFCICYLRGFLIILKEVLYSFTGVFYTNSYTLTSKISPITGHINGVSTRWKLNKSTRHLHSLPLLPCGFVDLQFITAHPWKCWFYYHRLLPSQLKCVDRHFKVDGGRGGLPPPPVIITIIIAAMVHICSPWFML